MDKHIDSNKNQSDTDKDIDAEAEEEYDKVNNDLRASQKIAKDLRFTTIKDSKYEDKPLPQTKPQSELVKFNFKIILLGNIAVGKTSIFHRFLFSQSNAKTEATIVPNIQTKVLNLDENTIVSLQICDTCGEELTKTIGKSFYKDVHGVVLVYDITNEESFKDLEHWVNEIRSHSCEDTITVLGGNKADLKAERVVSLDEAMKYAQRNNMDYYEISAKTGNNIYLLFEVLTSRIQLKFEEGGFKKQKNQKGRITLNKQDHLQKERESITKKKKCCK